VVHRPPCVVHATRAFAARDVGEHGDGWQREPARVCGVPWRTMDPKIEYAPMADAARITGFAVGDGKPLLM